MKLVPYNKVKETCLSTQVAGKSQNILYRLFPLSLQLVFNLNVPCIVVATAQLCVHTRRFAIYSCDLQFGVYI